MKAAVRTTVLYVTGATISALFLGQLPRNSGPNHEVNAPTAKPSKLN